MSKKPARKIAPAAPTKYEFRDRGMPPLEMELTSSELEAELVKQGQRMNYTRVYDVSGARAKMIYVRALGQVEWRAWDAMDSLARSAWEEQDRG
jgi:hypothetical protein